MSLLPMPKGKRQRLCGERVRSASGPIKDLDQRQAFKDLAAPGGAVDHVSLYFNAGHPGVEQPHYHIILWHVPKADEVRVAK